MTNTNRTAQDNQDSQYQALPEFQTYLWFLSHWSNFQTAFLVARDISEDQTEQDEIRPILQAMAEQYVSDKKIGAILTTAAFWDWWKLNNTLEKIQSRYTEAWFSANLCSAAA